MKQLSREQLERLSPETREKYEKQLYAVKRNRKILTGVIAFLAAAAVFGILSITVLFNVKTITVKETGKFYTKEEIISASGLDAGDNMIRTSFKAAAERIETMLPYVLTAKIDKSLSGAVTISVKDNTAAIIFKEKNGYAIADANGKVLDVLAEEPENSKLMVLKTSKELKAEKGKHIGFADDGESELFDKLCEALRKAGIYEKITGIDISNPVNIRIEYQNRLRIKIGTASDLDTKLSAAVKTIAMEDETDPNTIAEINATSPKKVYVNPLDSLEETTAPAEPVTEASTVPGEESAQEDDSEEADENTEENTDENSEEEEEEEETTEGEDSAEEEETEADEDENGDAEG